MEAPTEEGLAVMRDRLTELLDGVEKLVYATEDVLEMYVDVDAPFDSQHEKELLDRTEQSIRDVREAIGLFQGAALEDTGWPVMTFSPECGDHLTRLLEDRRGLTFRLTLRDGETFTFSFSHMDEVKRRPETGVPYYGHAMVGQRWIEKEHGEQTGPTETIALEDVAELYVY